MSFWRKVKRFFGVEPRHHTAVWQAMLAHMEAGRSFSRTEVARAALGEGPPTMDALREALDAVENIVERGMLADYGYTRSLVERRGGENWVFHPEDQPPEAPANADEGAPERPAGYRAAPRVPPEPEKNPYDTGDILRLSPEELRARAIANIQPLATGWAWRMDAIPPRSDERTALIDRGLVLRGLLTEKQLDEMHEVGDRHEEQRFADVAADRHGQAAGEAAVQAQKEERARNKEQKRQEAQQRQEARQRAIADRRANDIIFVGRGVSRQLNDRRSNVEKLQARGLPVLASPKDVADALGLDVPTLRWLSFHSEASERIHYVQFEVPKRNGKGTRLLSAPLPKLAAAQQWVLEHILAMLPVEPPAHGFVPGRSTVTGARPHRGQDVVVNLDLKDFFPTITLPRVRGVFRGLGYSPAVATLLALLCTEAPRRVVAYDGVRYHVAVGERGLPQGACTSPALSNQVARRLDRRLAGLASKHGLVYTRYADDLTFSAGTEKRGEVGMLLARVRHVIESEGFEVQVDKGRVQRAGGRQTVTGIVVNHPSKLGLPRHEVRRLRAILHNAEKTGLPAQNRAGHHDFEAHLRGKIAYLAMIDRDRAEALRKQLEAVTG